jgi:hypothetical protein
VNGSFHRHVWFENSADVCENNIVMAAHQPIGIKTWGKSVDRNLFANAADLDGRAGIPSEQAGPGEE